MTKTAENKVATPVALTDDVAGMADYVRSPEGRASIERGLADIRQGRTMEGKDVLACELNRRAAIRRDV
jgi:predicted transcriptional regulator